MADGQSEREKRLAEQLRANLRRRKAAARKTAKPNPPALPKEKP